MSPSGWTRSIFPSARAPAPAAGTTSSQHHLLSLSIPCFHSCRFSCSAARLEWSLKPSCDYSNPQLNMFLRLPAAFGVQTQILTRDPRTCKSWPHPTFFALFCWFLHLYGLCLELYTYIFSGDQTSNTRLFGKILMESTFWPHMGPFACQTKLTNAEWRAEGESDGSVPPLPSSFCPRTDPQRRRKRSDGREPCLKQPHTVACPHSASIFKQP